MEHFEEESIVLKNLSKEKKTIQKNKTLIKAIENADLSFIQELLVSDLCTEDVTNLSKYYKAKLLPLLMEFMDQPLRLEAIQCIYTIMMDIGNVEVFSKTLIARSADFNKLIFLKGKIDYLKYLKKSQFEDTPENTYEELNE